MEQWVLDGRDAIRDRGFSRIPTYVEEDGYTIDTTGGLRGMLKKKTASTASKNPDDDGTTREPKHVDPETQTTSQTTRPINYGKGLPQLYAECEVDYEYWFNGRIVDSNKEKVALDMLVKQIAKEAAEADRLKAMELEMEAQTEATVTSSKGDTISSSAATAPAAESNFSKIVVDGTTAFPTPTRIPTAGPYYPLELTLGAGQVTQAMDEALLSMYDGEETEWWVDPAFAFRDHGLRSKFGSIPADASIQMKVKLLRFVNPMSSYERILYATSMKDEANAILSKALRAEAHQGAAAAEAGSTESADSHESLMQQAVLAYNNALTKLGKTFIFKKASAPRSGPLDNGAAPLLVKKAKAAEESNGKSSGSKSHADDADAAPEEKSREEQMVMDAHLRAILFTNLSLCWFKRDDLARSTDYIDRATKCNPFYCKAIFRRALIEERRCNFEEAIALLESIIKLVDEGRATDLATVNKADIEAKIAALRSTSAKQDVAQRKAFQGMFAKGFVGA